VSIQGRFTKDPELRSTQSGIAVASFTLACDRDFKNDEGKRETDFIDCVAWRATAEFVTRNFTQGQMALVDGRLQKRQYQSQDGSNRYVTEIVVSNIYFCGPKPEGGGQQRQSIYGDTTPPMSQQQTQPKQDYGFDGDDIDLPF